MREKCLRYIREHRSQDWSTTVSGTCKDLVGAGGVCCSVMDARRYGVTYVVVSVAILLQCLDFSYGELICQRVAGYTV